MLEGKGFNGYHARARGQSGKEGYLLQYILRYREDELVCQYIS